MQRRWARIGAFALLGAIVLVLAVPPMLSLLGRYREEPARVAVKDKEAPPLIVQNVEGVKGTNLVAITIGHRDRVEDPYGSSGSPSAHNVVLLDRFSGANRRLLRDNSRRIKRITFLPAQAEGEITHTDKDPAEVTATVAQRVSPAPSSAYYIVEVAQAEGRRADVLIGNIADGSQAYLLTNIDGIDRMWMIAPDRLALLLRENMELRYRVIGIPALKLVASQPIEID